MTEVTIDGRKYDTGRLSYSTPALQAFIQLADRRIKSFKNKVSVLGRAPRGYADALCSLFKQDRDMTALNLTATVSGERT